MDVKKFMEHALSVARQDIEKTGGADATAFFFTDDRIGIMPIPGSVINDHDAKAGLSIVLKEMANKLKAVVVFVSDAWVHDSRDEEVHKVAREGRLHTLPDKKEALIATVFGPGVKPMLATQFYEREPKLVFHDIEWSNADGRFGPDMRKGGEQ